MKFLRIIILAILLLPNLVASAQQSIDSAMKALENSKSVINEVYDERRNPSTKAIVSSNRLYEFTDDKIANKLIEAIRKERSNATTFRMSRDVYNIEFEKKDGSAYSKYTLVRRNDGTWMFSVVKSTAKSSSSKKNRSHIEYYEVPGLPSDILMNVDGVNLAVFDGIELPVNSGIIHDSRGNVIMIESYDGDGCVSQVSMALAESQRSRARSQAAAARRQAAEARRQAAVAREQAAVARERAAEAREQAAEARRQAAEARRQAAEVRKQAGRSGSKSTTVTVSGSDYYVSYN